MLSHGSFPILLVAYASLVHAGIFPGEESLPGCGETCIDNMVAESSSLGCPDGSVGCLCGAANFNSGVHDCAVAACASDLFPAVTNYLASVCATPVVGAPTSVAPTPSTPPSVPSTTSTTAETAQSSTIPAVQSTTSTSSSTATTPTTTSSSSTGALPATTSSTSKPTSTASSKSTSTPHSTASSASSTSTAAAASSSLSVGAKAGIGIGAAVGAVAAIAAIVICVITRKHRRNSIRNTIQISEPMPGSGRLYPPGDFQTAMSHEGSGALEMKARRYEDMLPRQSPRNMV